MPSVRRFPLPHRLINPLPLACVELRGLVKFRCSVYSVRASELVRERSGPWNRTHGSRGLFYFTEADSGNEVICRQSLL